MKILGFIVPLVSLFMPSSSPLHVSDGERCKVTPAEVERLLTMEIEAFDSSELGWRKIATRKDCEAAAANVIKLYILFSFPSPPLDIKILRWHAGQLLASSEKKEEALLYFRATYDSEKGRIFALMWNEYVSGTIAFIKNDGKKLETARNNLRDLILSEEGKEWRRKHHSASIASDAEFLAVDSNYKILDNMHVCFRKLKYKDIYSLTSCSKK